MGKEKGLRAITNDIKRRFNAAVHEMAEELSFQIEKSYEQVIDAFYEDYTPAFYNRTYSTYYASNGYENPYSSNNVYPEGDAWVAGIMVGSEYIGGKPYRADTDWVFERTFEKGIHGYNKGDIDKRNQSRTKDTKVTVRKIKNMRPAPRRLMDKEFKSLTKKSNLDAMFNAAIGKYLAK